MKQRRLDTTESRNLKIVDNETSFMTRSEYYEKENLDYAKMRVGLKSLDDAVMNLGTYRKVNPNYGNKEFILKAIENHEYSTLREISDYFFEASGIYQRLCKYLALLYRYDWFVTPYIKSLDKINENKVLGDFAKVLNYLDNSDLKRLFGNIALEVVKKGSYYGCIVDFKEKFTI